MLITQQLQAPDPFEPSCSGDYSNLILLTLALLVVPLITAPRVDADPSSPLQQLQDHHQSIYKKLQPSVISIKCNVPNKDNPKQGPYIGTGVVISEDGYILSNTSVVPPGAKNIKIIFHDQTRKNAELIGASMRFEVALLKMKGEGYPTIPIGNSRSASTGDQIYSAGNAFDLARRQSNYSFSTGIISGIYDTESVYWQSQYKGLQIETDSSINPGGDGGPIISIHGRLIGIISLTADRSRWLGMAVPTHLFMPYIKVLKSYHEDNRKTGGQKPYLGVKLSEKTTQSESDTKGITVKSVTPESPAWYAGFRKGDLVYSAEGKEINTLDDMNEVMSDKKPGDQFLVFIERGHQRWSLLIRVGSGPF